jgi:hypothetical protein
MVVEVTDNGVLPVAIVDADWLPLTAPLVVRLPVRL